MVVKSAGKLGLLQLSSNMLVRHLALPGFNEICFLYCLSVPCVLHRFALVLTSASDHALPPPVDTVFLCRCKTGVCKLDRSEDEVVLMVMGFWVGA